MFDMDLNTCLDCIWYFLQYGWVQTTTMKSYQIYLTRQCYSQENTCFCDNIVTLKNFRMSDAWLPVLKSSVKLAGKHLWERNKYTVYRPGISLQKNFEFVFMQISKKYSGQLLLF